MNEKSNLSQAPIVLVRFDDPDKKPLLYACGKCGQIHSPRIYACNDALAHETARRAAEDCYTCRTHNTCQHCGDQCEKGWLACDKCKRSKRFENSKEVPLDGVEECFGFGKMPNAFADIDDAIDAAKCNTILDDSPDWKAVPVEIKRKFP